MDVFREHQLKAEARAAHAQAAKAEGDLLATLTEQHMAKHGMKRERYAEAMAAVYRANPEAFRSYALRLA